MFIYTYLYVHTYTCTAGPAPRRARPTEASGPYLGQGATAGHTRGKRRTHASTG